MYFVSEAGKSGPMLDVAQGLATFPVAPRQQVVTLDLSFYFSDKSGSLTPKDLRDPKNYSATLDVQFVRVENSIFSVDSDLIRLIVRQARGCFQRHTRLCYLFRTSTPFQMTRYSRYARFSLKTRQIVPRWREAENSMMRQYSGFEKDS